MITFGLLAVAMVVVAIASILVPLGRNPAQVDRSPLAANLEVLHRQRRELEQDLVRDAIDVRHYRIALRELDSRTSAEAGAASTDVSGSTPAPPPVWLVAAIAVIVPVAALALYRAVGTPYALDPAVLQMMASWSTHVGAAERLLPPSASAAGESTVSLHARSDAPGAALAQVAGTVTLAPELRERVAPDDVVFVIARPADGARAPLAVQRAQVRDLPLAFRLDDSLAMAPQLKLSNHQNVVVVARVARSGAALPATGDLEGMSGVVAVGEAGVAVTIDRRLQ